MWQPIETAPKERAFLGRADGMIAVCFIYDEDEKTTWRKRWPWSKAVPETRPKSTFIGFGLPGAGEYSLLNMRPDRGWAPEKWLSLDEIPW